MPVQRSRKGQPASGSPSAGEPEYLVVGLLRRPHGLKGELVMQVITDFPERLTVGSRVYLGDRHEPATIGSKREHPEGMVIRFKGIDSPEAAAGHRQQEVFVKSADRPELPAGMYYHHELIGFAVHDEGGVRLGTLREIMQTGANDVYVVAQSDGGEVLLPAIAPVILGIDTERKEIRVRAIPGLLEGTRTGKSNR